METPKVHLFCGDRIASFTVTGSLSVLELIEVLEKYYELVGARHLLWDFTQAELSKISDENFADIAAIAAMRLGRKEGRKTAYAAGDSAKYARLCRYMNVAFNAGVPAEYCVFLDKQSAVDWLHRS